VTESDQVATDTEKEGEPETHQAVTEPESDQVATEPERE
jgi:hypothetical protein